MNDVWILGATGRSGRAIAAELVARGVTPVLVGRDATRLRAMTGGEPLVADSVDAIVAELDRRKPAVVINTIGPFTETALPIARACRHYVDIANELFAVTGLLDLHGEAVAAGRCLVTGAGFGVLATESVVLKLCADRPPAARVRVDAFAAVTGAGLVGEALAASLVDGFRTGGRRYERGRLVRTRLGGDAERVTLPDGSTVGAAGAPSGELVAAQRASGAAYVVAGSGHLPTGRVARAMLPVVAALVSVPALGGVAKRRLAGVRVTPPERSGPAVSWARAQVRWPDGSSREGWLRMGEGMSFTAAVAAEVAIRLARDEGRPGAYTPGSLFGAELAERAGGRFLLDSTESAPQDLS